MSTPKWSRMSHRSRRAQALFRRSCFRAVTQISSPWVPPKIAFRAASFSATSRMPVGTSRSPHATLGTSTLSPAKTGSLPPAASLETASRIGARLDDAIAVARLLSR